MRMGQQTANCHFPIFFAECEQTVFNGVLRKTTEEKASILALFPNDEKSKEKQEESIKMLSDEELDYSDSSDTNIRKYRSESVHSDEDINEKFKEGDRKSDISVDDDRNVDSKDESFKKNEEIKSAKQKRTISDYADIEEPESIRETRRKVAKKEVSEDKILQDSYPVFALFNRRLDDEVCVYQSDFDTFKQNVKELDVDSIPGYQGTNEQIIRLLHLYKFKRLARDGTKATKQKLRNMKPSTFATSWNAMTKLLKKGAYEFDNFCAKKESQRDRLSNHGLGLKREVHEATSSRWGFCLILREEGRCVECSTHGTVFSHFTHCDKNFSQDYSDFSFEEQKAVSLYEKMLDTNRKESYAKANANASPRKKLVLRGYLPQGQSEEPRYLAPVGNQASERDTRSHATSYDYDSSYDDQQYDQRSNVRRHVNPPKEVAQDVEKNESTRLNECCESLSRDLNNAFDRIRDLETRCEELAVKLSGSSATSVAPSPASTDVEVRLCRLEARIAEVGQNGAEQREKLSTRVTDCQAKLLRYENRFEVLDTRTMKIVQGQTDLEKRRMDQHAELDRVVERADTQYRRLDVQKKALDQVLDVVFEKTQDLPSVLSFRDSQEREKAKKILQEARHAGDNV